MSTCRAIRCNDEMRCGRCALIWDVADPAPPKCPEPPERRAEPRPATFYCHTCSQHKALALKAAEGRRRAICKSCEAKILEKLK